MSNITILTLFLFVNIEYLYFFRQSSTILTSRDLVTSGKLMSYSLPVPALSHSDHLNQSKVPNPPYSLLKRQQINIV